MYPLGVLLYEGVLLLVLLYVWGWVEAGAGAEGGAVAWG